MNKETAKSAGLISCHFCDSLCRSPNNSAAQLTCPCCGTNIHSRVPSSLGKTWALLISAIILYIPANTLPVMSMVYLGEYSTDTIISGVMELLEEGLWPLALIVFVASIIVPISKLLVLSGLLISVHFKSHWRPRDRIYLYRLTEFVGRWSMVDIFVIAILVALVQFGTLATVHPGLGALSFATVVVLTMFAAQTFDPRLIWDAMEENNDRN